MAFPLLWLNHVYRYFYSISRLLSNFFSNILTDSDNIANRAVLIFYTHIHNTGGVRFTVKGDLRFHPSFSKLLVNIIGKPHISAALVRYRLNLCLEFTVHSIFGCAACLCEVFSASINIFSSAYNETGHKLLFFLYYLMLIILKRSLLNKYI